MLFDWLRRRRRRRILETPLPETWRARLEESLVFYAELDPGERAKVEADVRILLAEKHWEGCGSLEISDEMRVVIAGLAAVLVLGRTVDDYQGVETILVYPAEFHAPDADVLGENLVVEFESERLGEAWYRGPVVLSWAEIEEDLEYPEDGRNLVFHEFAHQLDSASGPGEFAHREAWERWRSVMASEYKRLVSATRKRRATLLDEYGATDEHEFFAVATESFFELPIDLEQEHPDLYRVLVDFYHQDPAARLRRTSVSRT